MHAMADSTSWSWSLHGNINFLYNNQRTKRGDTELNVIDWEMLMATRGGLALRAMTSLEPFFLGGDGYPELLQTGGSYRHAYIHDRQHPHDAIVELSARYDVGPAFLYLAPVGEPAAGPTSYMHRPSAERDPFAPLGHHWQDASHGSFGVVSAGLHAYGLTLEGSTFNAREADEGHLIADFRGARLDSYGSRLTWKPAQRLSIATWYAYLGSHDRLDPDTRMHRYGGSLEHTMSLDSVRRWSSSVIYGMNLHHHTGASHAVLHGGPNASPHHHASSVLAESSVDVTRDLTIFGRAERVMKNGEELGFLGGDLTEQYEIRSLSLGAVRRVYGRLSLGARGAVTFVPEELRATYGTRSPSGFALYLQVR